MTIAKVVREIDRLRGLTRREISMIYDIPPWLIGIYTDPADARADRRWWRYTWPKRKLRALRGWLRRR